MTTEERLEKLERKIEEMQAVINQCLAMAARNGMEMRLRNPENKKKLDAFFAANQDKIDKEFKF